MLSTLNRSQEMTAKIRTLKAAGWQMVKSGESASKYTEPQLRAAFEQVQNADGWKLPVSARIAAHDIVLVVAAVEFFTGSESYFSRIAGTNDLAIYSPGYYETVGV